MYCTIVSGNVRSSPHIYICFSDCDVRIADGIRTNNHLPFCHNEAVAYINFLSALADDSDTKQGVVTRNDLLALWDEYAGAQKSVGMLRFTYLHEATKSEIFIHVV